MAREMWNDPLPPEMFSPTDEEIRGIVDAAQASRPTQSRRRPRWNARAMGGLAAAALLIIGVSLASRGLSALWGNKLLPQGAGSAQAGIPKEDTEMVAEHQAARPEADGAPAAEAPQAALSDTPTPQASSAEADLVAEPPTSAPAQRTILAQEPQPAADEAPTSGSSASGSSGGRAEPIQALATRNASISDAIVMGEIKGGTLTVREVLYGSCDALVGVGVPQEGTAFVLLDKEDTFHLVESGPCVFLLKEGATLVLNAQGEVLEVSDELSESALREAFAGAR